LVYLDQSHVSYIFGARAPEGGVHRFTALRPWLDEIASAGRLCFSLAHVHECEAWLAPECDEFLRWLDDAPVRWVKPVTELYAIDEREAVLRAAGLHADTERTTTSFLRAVSPAWSADALGAALASVTRPSDAVRALRAQPNDQRRLRSWMPSIIDDIQRDRAHARGAGYEGSALRQFLDEKWSRGLTTRASVVYREMLQQALDSLGHPDFGLCEVSHDIVIERIRTAWLDGEDVFRCHRLARAFLDGLEDSTRDVDPQSKQTGRRFGSGAWDLAHAIMGGTNCEVFTCDRLTADIIGEGRRAFGFPAPMSVSEHTVDEFVDRLLRA
jgi:hypothetical protein